MQKHVPVNPDLIKRWVDAPHWELADVVLRANTLKDMVISLVLSGWHAAAFTTIPTGKHDWLKVSAIQNEMKCTLHVESHDFRSIAQNPISVSAD